MLVAPERSAPAIPTCDVDGVLEALASRHVGAVDISATLGCVPTIVIALGYIRVDFTVTSVRGWELGEFWREGVAQGNGPCELASRRRRGTSLGSTTISHVSGTIP